MKQTEGPLEPPSVRQEPAQREITPADMKAVMEQISQANKLAREAAIAAGATLHPRLAKIRDARNAD